MIDIREAFEDSSAEAGWSTDHEVSVLLAVLATELDGDLVEEYEAGTQL